MESSDADAPVPTDGPPTARTVNGELALDPTARWVGATTLLGGSPPVTLRLSDRGAHRLRALLDGTPVAPGDLAVLPRLVATGIVHPRPTPLRPAADDVTVVIPFHGDAGTIAPLLASLPAEHEVIVVDDASPTPPPVGARAVRVLTHRVNRGPAAARNTGLRAATTPYVAFVDADTRPATDWHHGLLAHFTWDDRLAVVAPRIRSTPGTTLLHRYEVARGPLDMGPLPGLVRRWGRLAYVPSAAWVARRDALEDVGGFDESLRFGEDVDLVWRLLDRGWHVRFEPAVTVEHAPRPTWGSAGRQRHQYGRSAATLWTRHPDRLRHFEAPVTMALPWLAAAGWGPVAGLGVGVVAGAATTGDGAIPRPVALDRFVRGTWQTGIRLATYVRRAALPVLGLAALRGHRASQRALTTSFARYVVDWGRERPAVDPLRYAACRLADDLAYMSGLWRGMAEIGRPGPVLPHLVGRGASSRARSVAP